MIVPIIIFSICFFLVGCMVGQLVERDRTDLPRATATRRQRRAWRKERLQVPRIPDSWRRS
jgi:hypothetical protein